MKPKLLIATLLLLSSGLFATTWQVGPTRPYTFCSQVAPLVQHGDTIEIDSASYFNDPQVQWNKDNLFITGVGGRPRLEAGPIIANDQTNGKGIFVISGANAHVNNIEFAKATVQDNNGAGIRQEGANLWVSHCKFDGNENGILAGNSPGSTIIVEYSEFLGGGSTFNPGFQHNLYINHVDSLIFRYNFSHDAIAQGHELKSRATYNFILYNRISNEQSDDSRTIDLPNGGTSVIVGNIIEQGANSVNSNLLGYGLEGLTNPGPHRLFCGNNTFVNKKGNGSFIHIQVGTDTLWVKNNIFAGPKTGGLFIGNPSVLDSSNNLVDDVITAVGFVGPVNFNYQLSATSVAINAGVNTSRKVFGYPLQASLMYVDTCNFEARPVDLAHDIGAFEYVAPVQIHSPEPPVVRCFPNPASDRLQIILDHHASPEASLQIRDALGVEHLRQQLHEGYNSVNLFGLSSGNYFLVLKIGNEVRIEKIVIHK